MSIFTKKVEYELEGRGILLRDTLYGREAALTTTGLAWLLNAIHLSGRAGCQLTLEPFRSAARLDPAAPDLRPLRLVATALPTPAGDYQVLSAYLVGTPPRLLHHFPPAHVLDQVIGWPAGGNTVMTLQKDWIVDVHLSPEELAALQAGEPVLIGPRWMQKAASIDFTCR